MPAPERGRNLLGQSVTMSESEMLSPPAPRCLICHEDVDVDRDHFRCGRPQCGIRLHAQCRREDVLARGPFAGCPYCFHGAAPATMRQFIHRQVCRTFCHLAVLWCVLPAFPVSFVAWGVLIQFAVPLLVFILGHRCFVRAMHQPVRAVATIRGLSWFVIAGAWVVLLASLFVRRSAGRDNVWPWVAIAFVSGCVCTAAMLHYVGVTTWLRLMRTVQSHAAFEDLDLNTVTVATTTSSSANDAV